LILQDATGVELVFPELADGEVATVDSKVTVDGKPADGEYLMPDGSTIIATAGIVTKIQPVEETTEEEAPAEPEAAAEGDEAPAQDDEKDTVIEELEAKIAELEAKLAELLPADAANKMLEALNASIGKQEELEIKFQALAKQVGSEFTIENNADVLSATVKAKQADTPKFSIKRK
jgi:hypothetical protein